MVVLLLGTNLGDRTNNLLIARTYLAGLLSQLKVSGIYETMPWGNFDQPNFLNQVITGEISIEADQLIKKTKEIESEMGREYYKKWGERIIDIDILYYDQQIIKKEGLEVPHPLLHERRFTLVPLVEVLPDFKHPVLQKTNLELLEQCPDQLSVKLIA